MSYSCTDFTDSILDALDIDVPEQSADIPSDQADAALAAIARLHAIEIAAREVIGEFPDGMRWHAVVKQLRESLRPLDFEWPETDEAESDE